eukprot:3955074-Alexandrium_andersonii.AAC.1
MPPKSDTVPAADVAGHLTAAVPGGQFVLNENGRLFTYLQVDGRRNVDIDAISESQVLQNLLPALMSSSRSQRAKRHSNKRAKRPQTRLRLFCASCCVIWAARS